MAVKCEEVWREISNYLEGDVDPGLRAAVEGHIRSCQRCSAVVNGTRNIVQLYGDERMLEVPLGFSYRLQRRVNENLVGSRRGFLGWMVAAAAAVVVSGAVEVSRSAVFGQPELRSKQARPGRGVPPDMLVTVYSDGKMFHVAGCPFIHDRTHLRTATAQEAEREGYAPCVRCMKQYLSPWIPAKGLLI
jgi:Putative zinc-finger